MVGFKFTVKEKHKPKLIAQERDQKTIDMFYNSQMHKSINTAQFFLKFQKFQNLVHFKIIHHLLCGFQEFYEIQNQ